MGLLNTLMRFVQNNANKHDKRSNHIFYKIVDLNIPKNEYILQCINTKAVIALRIEEIVFDIDILHGLHPIQACYVGIEYANYLEKNDTPMALKNNQKEKLDKCSVSRYGRYELSYQNRKGEILFVDRHNGKEFLMDPRDAALSEEIIQDFDAAQAFYIGLLAGLKLKNPTLNNKSKKSKPYLKLVETSHG